MYRDTWAEINLKQIRANLTIIRQTLPAQVKLMAVVKANGYGHGDVESARSAELAGADYLAVAYLEEAIHLRTEGIILPILILTPIKPDDVQLAIAFDLMLTVTSAAWFKAMRAFKAEASCSKLKVHVKMDTGLGRIGIKTKEEWDEIVPWLRAADMVVDGFYTHFATAGKEETAFLDQQADRFKTMMAWSERSSIRINHFHCAGSAAALRFPHLALDMVRIGAAMYGFYPQKLISHLRLEPALSLHSRLIQVKRLMKGEFLGYDNLYQAEADEWIGTIPIGYADGWSQRMQQTEVLIEGKRAPIVGKICMDQLMVRLPEYCEEGAKVTLIGKQGDEEITFSELAAHIGSVPQEISTSLTARVTREYTGKKEAEARWGKEILSYRSNNVLM
ncbi:alanine racemase [Paenibacillus endophyticus]|uniref:Alanine racemase n=1 Tax=Paenibacillus endophyticus TaxID=1294268 RepID=A0A7W5C5I3_9BACL|nr:alanine racemase [Paenibacillus endophyticus]MBB3151563.1 alanine racemase [Paenibacillus endophyticus]